MKIYLKNTGSCDLNYQHEYLESEISKYAQLTSDVESADVIVFIGTCTCTEMQTITTVNEMIDILDRAKKSAKVYMTGCLTRDFTKDSVVFDKVKRWIEANIDEVIPQNNPKLLIEKLCGTEFVNHCFEFGALSLFDNIAKVYISGGCLNKCSFCKTTYQKYPLISADIKHVEMMIDYCDMNGIDEIWLIGTNIAQYGVDNSGKFLLPEIISYIEQKENIKKVSLIGFAFADAIRNGFADVIRDSDKITYIGGSLESGSNRILKLMNKGFTIEELLSFIDCIREKSFKEIYTTVLAGFPTETLDDVILTLNVLDRIKPVGVDISRYTDSTFVNSHTYEQLAPETIQEHARIYRKVLCRRKVKNSIYTDDYVYNGSLAQYE